MSVRKNESRLEGPTIIRKQYVFGNLDSFLCADMTRQTDFQICLFFMIFKIFKARRLD